MSCSAILNDYDGIQHDYTRKQGLVWQAVFLPDHAPLEWQDRATLWNAVEANEKTKDSRLAREFIVALPIELDKAQWRELLTVFIQAQFVAEGMCADVAIHDTDGHNPHAHIMLTVRPLDEQGKWQYKTEKEYLCIKDGEERGFTAAEFKAAQADGWEKQYPYKDGKKKIYLPPSQAGDRVRADKHPKSTKYGRQNPISARWNSDEQFVLWRAAWADTTNQYLERYGHDVRIDHRSFADRGLDEQPTIHEGVVARALEKKGILADRCEINRQIRADNVFLRELKAQYQKLSSAVKESLPALAEAMEKARKSIILFCYQLAYIRRGKKDISDTLSILKPEYETLGRLMQKIKAAIRVRKSLLAQKKAAPAIHVFKHRELTAQIADVTEQLEDLKTDKVLFLNRLNYPETATGDMVRKDVERMEISLQKLVAQEGKYADELDAALKQYTELQNQASDINPEELHKQRMVIRSEKEAAIAQRVQAVYGEKYDSALFASSCKEASALLDEKPQSVLERIQQNQKVHEKGAHKKEEQEL